MFTLNNLTVKFSKANFNVDIGKRLELSGLAPVQTCEIREKPISYMIKLNIYSSHREKLIFCHHEDLPCDSYSSIGNKDIDRFDSREYMSPECWRGYFLSSTFGVLAQKI